MSPVVFEFISECERYEDAIKILNDLYDKPKNVIFARHLLATCKQENGQSLDQFLQSLKSLAKDCDFRNSTAQQIRDDAIRDSFISGLSNSNVRQRLLENDNLDLQKAFDMARSLELAQQQSLTYQNPNSSVCGASEETVQSPEEPTQPEISSLSAASSKCFFFVDIVAIPGISAQRVTQSAKVVAKLGIFKESVNLKRIRRQSLL